MKTFYTTLTFLLFISFQSFAQDGFQNVKGLVLDKQSEIPLIGATVQLVSTAENFGTTTDLDGRFQ